MLIERLAERIRRGEISVDDALAKMRNDEVLVWPENPPATTWSEVEDNTATYSGLPHALSAVGARHRYNEFVAEIQRLRAEGKTIELPG